MSDDELLLESARFRVVRRSRRSADGREYTKDAILHPGAVAVVPILDSGQVCLIRNYRLAVERALIEVPAGTLEVGEPPEATARRELAEETGYVAGELRHLTTFYMSPGILNERMHVFVATGLRPGPAKRELGEEIDNLLVAWEEALTMIRDGRIEDGKTIAALLFYDKLR